MFQWQLGGRFIKDKAKYGTGAIHITQSISGRGGFVHRVRIFLPSTSFLSGVPYLGKRFGAFRQYGKDILLDTLTILATP